MAITVPTSLVAAIGGIKISDYATSIETGVDVGVIDTTTFGSGSFTQSAAALRAAVVQMSGLNDIDAIETLLAAQLGAATVATVCPEGDTAGNVAGIAYGMVGQWRLVNVTVGQASTISVPLAPIAGGRPLQGLVTRGTSTAVTATGTTTAVQAGAAAVGAWASLHVLAISGTSPTITAQLQSSTTSGGSYTARGSASSSRNAVGSDWIVGATTTDTWWRLSLTVGGSGVSITALAAIGVL
jgi:hypothetical protein